MRASCALPATCPGNTKAAGHRVPRRLVNQHLTEDLVLCCFIRAKTRALPTSPPPCARALAHPGAAPCGAVPRVQRRTVPTRRIQFKTTMPARGGSGRSSDPGWRSSRLGRPEGRPYPTGRRTLCDRARIAHVASACTSRISGRISHPWYRLPSTSTVQTLLVWSVLRSLTGGPVCGLLEV